MTSPRGVATATVKPSAPTPAEIRDCTSVRQTWLPVAGSMRSTAPPAAAAYSAFSTTAGCRKVSLPLPIDRRHAVPTLRFERSSGNGAGGAFFSPNSPQPACRASASAAAAAAAILAAPRAARFIQDAADGSASSFSWITGRSGCCGPALSSASL